MQCFSSVAPAIPKPGWGTEFVKKHPLPGIKSHAKSAHSDGNTRTFRSSHRHKKYVFG